MLARAGALRRASAASTAASARRGMASASAAPPTFTGVWPIMATPFREDESADLESFAKCISFMNEAGCDGATIIGVLGESNRLLDAEREALIRTAIAAAGDMPICVGTSHPGTLATRGLSQMAQELGAKAVMVTPSKEGVPLADDRMVEYFAKVAEGIDISIVLQDHPASTQVNMSVPLLARLVNEIPQIANVKLESLPSPVRIPLLKSLMREDCTILTGLGALYGVFDAEAGMDGFMTGFAFPEALKAIVDAHQQGRTEEAFAIYRHWLPLMVFEQQPGVAVRKELYRLRGILGCNIARHPAASINPGAAGMLQRTITKTLPEGTDITRPLSREAVVSAALATLP